MLLIFELESLTGSNIVKINQIIIQEVRKYQQILRWKEIFGEEKG